MSNDENETATPKPARRLLRWGALTDAQKHKWIAAARKGELGRFTVDELWRYRDLADQRSDVVARLLAEVEAVEQTNAELLAGSARKSLEVERLTAALADEEAAHAKTADNFEVFAAADEVERADYLRALARAARLRERVRDAESPARARTIIAAWGAAGDQMWSAAPADTPAAICLDGVDLAAIHGSPTGAAPALTGPEYVVSVRESGLTTEDVEAIREGVRRHRGDPAKHVDAFFGTLSSEETDEEFTEDDGATPSDPAWSDEWPTLPGYYWLVDGDRDAEVAQCIGTDGASVHVIGGSITYPSEWPGVLWGPRIDDVQGPTEGDQ